MTTEPAPHTAYAPLAGVRVVEWCEQAAGPFAGKLLAQLGADVIKVEAPDGDPARAAGPFPGDVPDPEASALFLYTNTGKRSIVLDATSEAGAPLLRRLIAEWADVYLEDRMPSQAEALGLTYARLAESKPALVVASVTPFGTTGPYRNFKTYPSQTSHAGGAAYLQPSGQLYIGDPSVPPVRLPAYLPDFTAGLQTALAIVSAILERRRSGRGQHIDVSKQQAQMHPVKAALDSLPNDAAVTVRVNAPSDVRGPRAALSGTKRARDGFVTLWPLETYMPQALIDWLGNPEWSNDPRWAVPAQRDAADEFRVGLTADLLQHDKQELFHGLQAKSVAISSIDTAEEVVHSPQLAAREFFQPVPAPPAVAAGELPMPVFPFKTSAWADALPREAPRLGQHTEQVLGTLLGLDAAAIAHLRAQSVTAPNVSTQKVTG